VSQPQYPPPGDPQYGGQPAYGQQPQQPQQPGFPPAGPPGFPPAGLPEPPPKKKSPLKVILGVVIGLILVCVVIVVIAAVAGGGGSDYKAGDCLSGSDANSIKKVDCSKPHSYKVLGKLKDKQTEANATAELCAATYASTDAAYWEGKSGEKGNVFCLAKDG